MSRLFVWLKILAIVRIGHEHTHNQRINHRQSGTCQPQGAKIRQDDAAGSVGVSENFLGKVERGSESVQWGKLFQVLKGLGIRVMVDVPEDVAAHLEAVRSKGQS